MSFDEIKDDLVKFFKKFIGKTYELSDLEAEIQKISPDTEFNMGDTDVVTCSVSTATDGTREVSYIISYIDLEFKGYELVFNLYFKDKYDSEVYGYEEGEDFESDDELEDYLQEEIWDAGYDAINYTLTVDSIEVFNSDETDSITIE